MLQKKILKKLKKLNQILQKKIMKKNLKLKKFQNKLIKKNIAVKKLSTENKELYGSVKPTEISKIIHETEQNRY